MRAISERTGRLVIVILLLLLLATVAFGIGVAVEKSEAGEHSGPVAAAHSEAGEESGAEGAPASEEAPSAEDAHADETLLGVSMESTLLVVVGIAISLLAAAAVWLFGERRRVLEVVALFCLGFAVLDAIEAGRKLGDEATIAAFALVALVLHAAAGASAAALARRTDPRAVPAG